jgi:hypothetical protein
MGRLHPLLLVLTSWAGPAAADCPLLARVEGGEPRVVQAVVSQLRALGVWAFTGTLTDDALWGCAEAKVKVGIRNHRLRVIMRDPTGIEQQRDVDSAATAAALVESWFRSAAGEVPAHRLPGPPMPPASWRFTAAGDLTAGSGSLLMGGLELTGSHHVTRNVRAALHLRGSAGRAYNEVVERPGAELGYVASAYLTTQDAELRGGVGFGLGARHTVAPTARLLPVFETRLALEVQASALTWLTLSLVISAALDDRDGAPTQALVTTRLGVGVTWEVE